MKKITVYSSESIKETHDRLKILTDKLEERENRSMGRSLWNMLTKKPVIGKPKGVKKNEE
jgi:hypothetical protein